jgi:exportin-T
LLITCPLFCFYVRCLGNSRGFEALIESVQRLAEDISDPPGQKGAFTFLNRCISTWGQPPSSKEGQSGSSSLPGFDRFIYERLVPTAFRVISLPGFNPKDGQMIMVSVINKYDLLFRAIFSIQVLHEIANLLQVVCQARGDEAYSYFLIVFLPSQNWPQETALEFTKKLRDLDGKGFRKYFTDIVRSSGPSS